MSDSSERVKDQSRREHEKTLKISILIAAYNEEASIAACLSSVINQTEQRFEVILINDGSTDRTLEMATSIADSRMRIYTKKNEGLVRALNYGLGKCRAELVARLDADDICDKTRLEKQLHCFERDSDLLLCGTWSITKYRSSMRAFCPPVGERGIRREMTYDNPFVHSSVMFRRHIVETLGGYKNIRPCEDYELWIRIAEQGKVEIIPEPLVTRHEERNLETRAFYTGLSRAKIYKARMRCQIKAATALGYSPITPLWITLTGIKYIIHLAIERLNIRWRQVLRDHKSVYGQGRTPVKTRPLVSVIIPLYNDKKNICRAINGILKQTYTSIEVIVVDDGSTDGGPALVEAEFGGRVLVVKKPRGGVSSALNLGIQKSKGEYIAINDSDDESLEGRIEHQMEVLLSNEGITCVGTSAITYDEAGNVVVLNLMPTTEADIQKSKFQKNPFVHSSAIYPRWAYNRAGGYNERYNTMQDYDLWLSMLSWGRGINLNEIYVKRIQRSGSHTRIPRREHYWRSAKLKLSHYFLRKREPRALSSALLDLSACVGTGILDVVKHSLKHL